MCPLDCKPCIDLGRFQDDWCRAGGVKNWQAIGIMTEHPNYGYPHVIEVGRTNCTFCGKQI